MPEDYARATAAPRTVTIGGATYLASKFAPRDFGDLAAFLKDQVPDPRLKARELCAGLSDAVALQIWTELSEEAKDWPPTITSRAGNQLLMMTLEGNARIIWIALRRYNPGVTLERARQIAETVTMEEIVDLFHAGFPEETFDPKARTATEPSPG
jgi:hypothetical protein